MLPARILNEFIYCPRLTYLEWVQGEWADNADTIEGRHVHRRVDTPSGSLPKASEQNSTEKPVIHSRSLLLGSDKLGLIARLDLIEGKGNSVIPVDYKKSKRPHIAGGAYDPERVQLCAQGLLLREHGFECQEGIIYYAGSKERVHVSFDEALIQLTLDSIRKARELPDHPPPAPLNDSPKCPRCSLVTLCLPDEINWYHKLEEAPRRIAVRHEERAPVYVQTPFGTVRKKGEKIEIEAEDTVHSARIEEISHLALYGNIHVTGPTIQALLKQDISLSWHTHGGWYYGTATSMGQKNVQLRINQFRTFFDKDRSHRIACSLVRAKIMNCRTLLRRNWRGREGAAESVLRALKDLADQTGKATTAGQLLGLEGQAAHLYFQNFEKLIKDRDISPFQFSQRNRRPPRDPVNAMLSFAYSILARTWAATLHAVGYDPSVGFYHQPRAGRPGLALDMMEPFRPLVADSAVITAINNGEVSEHDFITRGDECALTPSGRKKFIGTVERRLSQLVTHPAFGYRISYRRLFELEARLLGRFLSGEIPHYQCFTTR